MIKLLLSLLLCNGVMSCFAQKRMTVSYPDGIYTDGASFLLGKPEARIEDYVQDWFVSNEDDYGRFVLKENAKQIAPLPKVVCVQGDCYIHDPNRSDSSILYLAKLVDIGSLCLYKQHLVITEWLPMKVYNPVSGRPYMEGRIPNQHSYLQWFMWRPSDGGIRQLDRQSYYEWTGFENEGVTREQDMIQGVRLFNQIHPIETVESKNN